MIGLLPNYIIPGTLSIMPPKMNSEAAQAMLFAICLQESKAIDRIQKKNGPAHGLWQFEMAGVEAVIKHKTVGPIFEDVCRTLLYERDLSVEEIHFLIIHNDFLACALARLLLWTFPGQLPKRGESGVGWNQYVYSWRPGKPRPSTWVHNFDSGWNLINV